MDGSDRAVLNYIRVFPVSRVLPIVQFKPRDYAQVQKVFIEGPKPSSQ